MLGVSLLVVSVAAAVVVLGLVAAAVVVRGRPGRARPAGRSRALLAGASLLLLLPGIAVAAAPPAAAAPAEHITTVRYGPLLLPPYLAMGSAQSEHGGHGGQMITYGAPTYNMPCRNCYITGIQPDLVYADGSPANYDTGAMLHHMVLFDPTQPDTTCGRQGVGLVTGQRIFAAGNERTGAHLPPGYGYHLGTAPLGAMAELMNMSPQLQQVYVTVRVSWVEAGSAPLKEVTPVWLDIDNCGDSQYSVPAGPSHTTWTWKSTLDGEIVTVGGHVHDQGISITLSNATRNETICESVAGYSSGSHHEGHVESMSTCTGDPLGIVRTGDDLMLDSYYHAAMPDDTVMGIMLAYLHQTG